jgi:hypothetical protein
MKKNGFIFGLLAMALVVGLFFAGCVNALSTPGTRFQISYDGIDNFQVALLDVEEGTTVTGQWQISPNGTDSWVDAGSFSYTPDAISPNGTSVGVVDAFDTPPTSGQYVRLHLTSPDILDSNVVQYNPYTP